jgi:hypothetical protein
MATGTIYESSGSFYVRYSVGMTVSKNGKTAPDLEVPPPRREEPQNHKYYSSKAREVKLLRDTFMLTVRACTI